MLPLVMSTSRLSNSRSRTVDMIRRAGRIDRV